MDILRKFSSFKNATEKGTSNAMSYRIAVVWNIIMVSFSSVSSVWSYLEASSILTSCNSSFCPNLRSNNKCTRKTPKPRWGIAAWICIYCQKNLFNWNASFTKATGEICVPPFKPFFDSTFYILTPHILRNSLKACEGKFRLDMK